MADERLARKQLVGQLMESGKATREVQIIGDEVIGDQIIETFADGDTTPSVAVPNSSFKTANTGATTITDLDDAFSGQVVTIVFGDANTTVDFTASNLVGNGGVDWTPAVNQQMTCVYDGTTWNCSVPTAAAGAEVNDLTAAVTWANVPDANITQSSVTQHQAALTIVEGQITGANFSNWDTAFSWGNHAGLYEPADAAIVKSDEAETITASWNFDTDTGIAPFRISRLGGTSEALSISVNDSAVEFDYAQDETTGTHRIDFDYVHSGAGNAVGSHQYRILYEGSPRHTFYMDAAQSGYYMSGGQLRIYDDGVTDYCALSHTGTDLRLDCINTTDWDITGITSMDLYANMWIIGGNNLAIFDASGSNYVVIDHTGSTFRADFVNTTNWDIDNLSGNLRLLAGAGLDIFDTFDTDKVNMSHDGTDFNIVGTNTADLNFSGMTTVTSAVQINAEANIKVDDSVYLNERANAAADITNYGQIFTKNTTPQELWFASDDGVEHHVAGGSLSETFGAVKSSSELVTSSTTLQNDNHLAIDLAASTSYSITMILNLSRVTDATNCGFKWDFSIPSGATGAYTWYHLNTGTTSATYGATTSFTADQTISTLPAGSTRKLLVIQGTITTSSSGTFQFRWAQNTSSVGSAVVRSGSSLMMIR